MKEAGVLPRALAVAQDATAGLGKALGVPEERSQNITLFLRSEPGWAERKGWEWWIIDEASMIGSHDWDALLKRAKANGTRVLAVGDPAQLGSVGPGGLFSVMAHHPEIPTAELVRVWRMEAKWEQAASLQLRERNPAAADVYAEHGGSATTATSTSCWTVSPPPTPKARTCWSWPMPAGGSTPSTTLCRPG